MSSVFGEGAHFLKGQTICERIERLKEVADIEVVAVVVIADLTNEEAKEKGLGAQMLEARYGAKVVSIIQEKDVINYLNR